MEPVLTFDIGGTWWRVGLLTEEGEVRLLSRVPAVSRHGNPDRPTADLQTELVDFLVRSAREALREHALDRVGVSMGAALNGHTGRIWASAPLWGSEIAPFDLLTPLRAELPALTWKVINDVSALAVALRAQAPPDRTKAAAVTVSTGIAYRTIDLRTGHIPLDPVYGLQGEIGHLPVEFAMDGRPVVARCDCGVPGHLAAYSSGRGIEALLTTLDQAAWLRSPARSGDRPIVVLARAVRDGDPRAVRLLDAFTLPLARILLTQTTLDPEVDLTVLSGGVVELLGDEYRASVLRNLGAGGVYGVTDRDPGYFERRMVLGSRDGLDALRGAGLHAGSSPPLALSGTRPQSRTGDRR
ncbi:ROK family protein [Streptomyces sp. NPDC088258]|uniref:ROK family protein n=1 Tax=Streptomyces sp. NPDC088258 TaxID=3365849 RepID=UPI0038247B96